MWNSKGFTLIELMVVAAIIGILAAIAIPNFLQFQCRSHAEKAGISKAYAKERCAENYNWRADGDHKGAEAKAAPEQPATYCEAPPVSVDLQACKIMLEAEKRRADEFKAMCAEGKSDWR